MFELVTEYRVIEVILTIGVAIIAYTIWVDMAKQDKKQHNGIWRHRNDKSRTARKATESRRKSS